MNITKIRRYHRVHFIVNVALKVATLVTVGLAVHELDRINHRLHKIERREKHRVL